MKRKIYEKLLEWKKNNGKCSIFIDGARRVGKTYVVKEFAEKEYTTNLIIDFSIASDAVKKIFIDNSDNLNNLFINLSLYYNVKLIPRETLIVFDEIQFFPKARTLIKHLVLDGRFDYIETGSLVSIKENVKDILIPSEEHHLIMFPMDFEEFLWAVNEKMLYDYIKEMYNKLQPLDEAIHRKVINYFNIYTIIGGMPQAVLEYVNNMNNPDFIEIDNIKKRILDLYKQDIRKHASGYELKVEALFEEIPSQLSKHDKKYRLSAISKDARYREYEDAIFWLVDAKILNPIYNCTEPNLGIRLTKTRNTFKGYMMDTGLLITHAFSMDTNQIKEVYQKIISNKLEFNKGLIIENIVAQMLRVNHQNVYFYSKSSNEKNDRMEIDFIIPKSKITSRHNINILEVKSGKNYTYNSLNKFFKKYYEYINQRIIVHTGNLKIENEIIFIPLYMVPLL